MMSGTSKISLKVGPIIGRFWARGRVFMAFLIPKIIQKLLESIWEHLGKYYFCIYENQKIRFFGLACVWHTEQAWALTSRCHERNSILWKDKANPPYGMVYIGTSQFHLLFIFSFQRTPTRGDYTCREGGTDPYYNEGLALCRRCFKAICWRRSFKIRWNRYPRLWTLYMSHEAVGLHAKNEEILDILRTIVLGC